MKFLFFLATSALWHYPSEEVNFNLTATVDQFYDLARHYCRTHWAEAFSIPDTLSPSFLHRR